MTPFRFYRRLATMAALLAVALPAAATEGPLPDAHESGGVRYVTGGVGQRESQAFLQHRREYPLSVEIYARDGGHEVYTAGASVSIRSSKGDTVLEATADGPFLLADLPPGRYGIAVTREGETLRKQVPVGQSGTSRAVFMFGPGS